MIEKPTDAEEPEDEFKLIELYWWMDPELRVARAKNEKIRLSPDEHYWKKKCNLDDMLFFQEYPSDYPKDM